MRAAAAALLLACVSAAAAPPAPIPCRNLKSDAQCSADERARDRGTPVSGDQLSEVRTPSGVVRVEKLTVTADPEDLPAPGKDKWERFNTSVTAKPRMQEFVGNDGTRMMCVEEPPPCKVNCCVRLKEFNLTGNSAGR